MTFLILLTPVINNSSENETKHTGVAVGVGEEKLEPHAYPHTHTQKCEKQIVLWLLVSPP
jgi:hypothetical protein